MGVHSIIIVYEAVAFGLVKLKYSLEYIVRRNKVPLNFGNWGISFYFTFAFVYLDKFLPLID